ncbi:hypothetical protein FPV67DRAFT_1097807 [Lyophyllum atratum]|nr:hypothetical protein FPV67DRAFT_1097807 [Lyophyllum atratum]
MAQPLPYTDRQLLLAAGLSATSTQPPTSPWQQFQSMGRSSQQPTASSSSWPMYYEQPDAWPAELPQQDSYRSHVELSTSYVYPDPAWRPSVPCPGHTVFPPASRDPHASASPPHSSPSPLDDHDSDTQPYEEEEAGLGLLDMGAGFTRPTLLTSSFTPRTNPYPRHSPSTPTPSPTPSVKEEPEDVESPFIMEISAPQAYTSLLSQSLAPPTEVPLRATQASSEMRSMMTAFRINPFTMHNGEGRGTVPVQHEVAHALDAEPLIFEFQLDLYNMDIVHVDPCDPNLGLDLKDTVESEPLRSFSPDFELHEAQTISEVDHDQNEWREYSADASGKPPTPDPQTWELGFPQSEDRFSTLTSSTNMPHYHSSPRRQPRLHHSFSHPYLQKAAAGGDSGYTSSSSSGVHLHNHTHSHSQHGQANYNHNHNHHLYHKQHHRMAPPEQQVSQHYPQWATSSSSSLRGAGYHDTASRSSSTTYASSGSPGCDLADSPALSIVPVRRWSLPDTHPHANIHAPAPMPFLA